MRLKSWIAAVALVIVSALPVSAGSMLLTGVGPAPSVVATTTWNPADKSSSITLSNGNLTATVAGSGGVRAVASHSTGKFFYSMVSSGPSTNNDNYGFSNSTASVTTGFGGTDLNAVSCYANGNVFLNNSGIGTGTAYAVGDVLDIAIDLGAKLIWQRVNGGNWNASGTANPATGVGGFSFSSVNSGPYFPTGWLSTSTTSFTTNFGATAYSFAAPSGFGNW